MNIFYQTSSIIILLLTICASVIAIIRIRSWYTFFLIFGIIARFFFFFFNTRWLMYYGYSSYSYDILNVLARVFDLLFVVGLIGLALNTRKRNENFVQQGHNASTTYNQAGVIPAASVRSWPHSLAFYFVSILVCGLVSMPLSCLSLAATFNDEPEIGMVLSFLTFPINIFAVVVLCLFIYHAWKLLQPYGVRTTPGKAVGFLFIPLFNLYWVFQVFYGLAKDYNRIVKERSLGLNLISEGLALTYCILILFSVIPIVGIFIGIITFILLLVFICKAYKAIDKLNKVNLASTPSAEPCIPISTSPENS